MTPELRGPAIIREPRLNRLAAFTEAEREQLGLVGLVPECVDNHEIQLRRAARRLAEKPLGFVNYLELRNLQDTDETLFYRLLRSDPSRFLPLVYTPTVAEACLRFGDLATRPRGLFLSIRRRGHVREILRNWPERDVRFITSRVVRGFLGLAISALTVCRFQSASWCSTAPLGVCLLGSLCQSPLIAEPTTRRF